MSIQITNQKIVKYEGSQQTPLQVTSVWNVVRYGQFQMGVTENGQIVTRRIGKKQGRAWHFEVYPERYAELFNTTAQEILEAMS
jgi:hypothetical protein